MRLSRAQRMLQNDAAWRLAHWLLDIARREWATGDRSLMELLDSLRQYNKC